MTFNKKYLVTITLSLLSSISHAQSDVEMADIFRSDGKIYVVVGTIGIILAGIIFYLFRTEQKLSMLEKEIKAKS